jgi:hypothetical protein
MVLSLCQRFPTGELQKPATCDQGECDKTETEHQLHLRKAQKATSSLQENKELAKHSSDVYKFF